MWFVLQNTYTTLYYNIIMALATRADHYGLINLEYVFFIVRIYVTENHEPAV